MENLYEMNFIIDVTGSMSSHIKNLNNTLMYYLMMFETCKVSLKQLNFFLYTDYPAQRVSDARSRVVEKRSFFDYSSARSFLSGIKCDGGGDSEEAFATVLLDFLQPITKKEELVEVFISLDKYISSDAFRSTMPMPNDTSASVFGHPRLNFILSDDQGHANNDTEEARFEFSVIGDYQKPTRLRDIVKSVEHPSDYYYIICPSNKKLYYDKIFDFTRENIHYFDLNSYYKETVVLDSLYDHFDIADIDQASLINVFEEIVADGSISFEIKTSFLTNSFVKYIFRNKHRFGEFSRYFMGFKQCIDDMKMNALFTTIKTDVVIQTKKYFDMFNNIDGYALTVPKKPLSEDLDVTKILEGKACFALCQLLRAASVDRIERVDSERYNAVDIDAEDVVDNLMCLYYPGVMFRSFNLKCLNASCFIVAYPDMLKRNPHFQHSLDSVYKKCADMLSLLRLEITDFSYNKFKLFEQCKDFLSDKSKMFVSTCLSVNRLKSLFKFNIPVVNTKRKQPSNTLLETGCSKQVQMTLGTCSATEQCRECAHHVSSLEIVDNSCFRCSLGLPVDVYLPDYYLCKFCNKMFYVYNTKKIKSVKCNISNYNFGYYNVQCQTCKQVFISRRNEALLACICCDVQVKSTVKNISSFKWIMDKINNKQLTWGNLGISLVVLRTHDEFNLTKEMSFSTMVRECLDNGTLISLTTPSPPSPHLSMKDRDILDTLFKLVEHSCAICFKTIKNLYKCNCNIKYCYSCIEQLIQKNKIGSTKVLMKHFACVYCFRLFDSDVYSQTGYKPPLNISSDFANTYGWCVLCNKLSYDQSFGTPACNQPELQLYADNNYKCCMIDKKFCPKCGVETEKLGGCNHMTCNLCKPPTHWCYNCCVELDVDTINTHTCNPS